MVHLHHGQLAGRILLFDYVEIAVVALLLVCRLRMCVVRFAHWFVAWESGGYFL